MRVLFGLAFAGLTLVSFCGCATTMARRDALSHQASENAVNLLQTVRTEIIRAGVEDAHYLTIDGFPFLRTNRYGLVLLEQAITPEQQEYWLGDAFRLGREAYLQEYGNLPLASQERLERIFSSLADDGLLRNEIEEQLQTAFDLAQQDDRLFDKVKAGTRDPGDYSTFMRVVGLYPVFSFVIKQGAKKAYTGFKNWFLEPLENLKVVGQLTYFEPAQQIKLKASDTQLQIKNLARDPFGLPQLSADDQEQLAATLAPVLWQDVDGTFDEIGALEWRDSKVTVNPQRPTVYYYFSQAFVNGEPAWQVNYSFWYEGRLGANAPWLERGRLDGVTVRFTLNGKGDVVMVDLMNSCGCYHFFVPNAQAVVRTKVLEEGLDPLVLTSLPDRFPQERLVLRLASGWHQVQYLLTGTGESSRREYELKPYAELEQLAMFSGQTKSVFNKHGVMKDSSRIEPIVFFPSGIAKVGFMRQRGNHPTKLAGREYFDNPRLLDERFEFKN